MCERRKEEGGRREWPMREGPWRESGRDEKRKGREEGMGEWSIAGTILWDCAKKKVRKWVQMAEYRTAIS